MTRRRSNGDAPADTIGDVAARRARGSVHEAIGKLIGDDAATERGTAEKRAADDEVTPSS